MKLWIQTHRAVSSADMFEAATQRSDVVQRSDWYIFTCVG